MSGLNVDPEVCTRCGICVDRCPFDALVLPADGGAVRVTDACVLCGACVEACPLAALAIAEGTAAEPAPAGFSGVWVWGEHHAGSFHPVVYELVAKGGELAADRGCRLAVATLVGARTDPAELAGQLAGRGVEDLHLACHPDLEPHRDGAAARALADLVVAGKPEIVLAGATSRGRALLPRLATLLATGLTADCTGLAIDPERGDLLQTRPAFGGNIMATIVTRRHRPQLATVRPRVFAAAVPAGSALPRVRAHRAEPPTDPVTVIRAAISAEGGTDIADAEVLVAGGRGLGDAAGFELLAGLAAALGGQVAASRAAVDAGWAPARCQVGQTGKTVHPRLYLAIGISGAVQHVVGMGAAETVVAINADPDAPIFRAADYGIVGDWRPVAEALLTTLGPSALKNCYKKRRV